jgi:hypothetical protein
MVSDGAKGGDIVALDIPLLFLACMVSDDGKGSNIVALDTPLLLLDCMVSDDAKGGDIVVFSLSLFSSLPAWFRMALKAATLLL